MAFNRNVINTKLVTTTLYIKRFKIIMDIIFINKLTIFTFIGIYDWEKLIKQKLIFDIEMSWNNSETLISNSITHCLNYAEVSDFIINYLHNKHFSLIETLAHEVAIILMNTFKIKWIRIKIIKNFNHEMIKGIKVGIQIERGILN